MDTRVEKKAKIILLHGIGRTAYSMKWLQWRLRHSGFDVINLAYPSKKLNLEGCADFLRAKIQNYPAQSLSFVTHSMGGIVLRKYIEKYGEDQFYRIVMLGVPNQGSYVAYKLRKIIPYVLGPASLELGDKQKISSLPIPHCEFAIIAGYGGSRFGLNPFIPGDNDFLVTVEETQLLGVKEFLKVKNFHAFLMFGHKPIGYIRSFLATGHATPS
jgi:pimeloyl-ACP methyl ester carboxylesterase